jgi:shikimate dehydrogenase
VRARAGGKAAVLGRPVTHSLSPVLHRAAYAALGLDWTYDAIDCGVDELPAVLADRPDWCGFSCTMPLKHAALAIADEARPAAVAVGAANTLLPRAGGAVGGWVADNTDVDGVIGALTEAGPATRDVVVLGAGGTAQAVIAALPVIAGDSCSATVLVRDPTRTAALLRTAERVGVAVSLALLDAPQPDAALVVSTLPPGAADLVAERFTWSAGQTLLDVVYDPWPTALASAAARGGAQVISGAVLLLHQAAAQVRLMTGCEPPVIEMRAALAAVRPGIEA